MMTMRCLPLPALALATLTGCGEPGPTRESVCADHIASVRQLEDARAMVASVIRLDGVVTEEEQAGLDETDASIAEFREMGGILCKAE